MRTETQNNETSTVKLGIGYVANAISPLFNKVGKALDKAPIFTALTIAGGMAGSIIGGIALLDGASMNEAVYVGSIILSGFAAAGTVGEVGALGIRYVQQASQDAKAHKKNAKVLKSN